MSTVIKAVFDSPDSADNALATLRRNNLNVQAYDVAPSRNTRRDGWDVPDAFPGVAAPMPTNAMPLGGMTSSIMPLGAVYDYEHSVLPRDARSEEVIIHITIDDAQANAAEAALISVGGLQVKRV